MKTQVKELEKVIERNDYKRLSKKLAEKCEELADIIIDKMIELEIDKLDDLKLLKASLSGFTEYYLVISEFSVDADFGYDKDSGVLNVCKISRGLNANGYYFAGNFNYYVNFAKSKEALYFLNNAKKYLDLLDKIETKKSEKFKESLKQVNNL